MTWLRDSREIPIVVNERSTLPIPLEFRDGGEAGALVTPTATVWSLVDTAGTVINSRSEVALSVVSGEATIVLTNADLANTGTAEVERRVTVDATYDSVAYGAGRRLTAEFRFYVAPLAGIPADG